jgi:hypothetical protein
MSGEAGDLPRSSITVFRISLDVNWVLGRGDVT